MRLVAAFLLLLLCGTAHAQNLPVYQTGLVTPGHVGVWVTPGVMQDDVLPSGDYSANAFGLTATGLPFCINDASRSSAGGYHQLCIGALATIGNTTGGFITYNAYGGATAYGLSCIINGANLPCFPSGGNVTGPTNPYPTAGDAVIWNGSDTVKDGGAPPALVVPSNAALQALSITNIASGTSVLRAAFYAGVSPNQPTVYTLTSANCGDADNGLEVQPNVGTGCWLAQVVTASPTMWGATGSITQETCSISAASTTMTLGAAGDFVNGEPIFCTGPGANASTSAPSLAVAATNGSGTTTYYTIRPLDGNMGVGPAITPVSVSGGALLGTPQALNEGGFTGTTNGTTTISGISLPAGCATLAACVAVNDFVKKGDVPAGTYVTIVGSTTVTLNTSTGVGSSTSAISFLSPTSGIFNGLTITGTSAGGFAIYKGTSATLSAMNCLSTITGNVEPWKDYGQTAGCPAWVPGTANLTQNDVYRGTIVSGGGTTTLQVTPPATNAVTGGASYNIASHDDSTAIDDAVGSNVSLSWNCGEYNLLVGASTSLPIKDDMNGCATIYGWGPANNITLAGAGADNAVLLGSTFNDNEKSIGFDVVVNGAGRTLIRNLNSTGTANCIEATDTGNPRFENIYCGIGSYFSGDYCIYMTGVSGTSLVNNPSIINTSCGPGYNNYSFLADGDVNSITCQNFGFFPSRAEFVLQNTVGGAKGPNLGKCEDVGINNAWGIPAQLNASDTFYNMVHWYIQCVQGNGQPGLYVGANADAHLSGKTAIFGCDKQGVDDFGQLSTDNSVQIWGNNLLNGQAGGGYAKIELENGSGAANIQMDTGDQGGAPSEEYGVQIDSGAGGSSGLGVSKWYPAIRVSSYIPGYACTINDQTTSYGIVQVDGLLGNSPTCEVANNASPPTAGTFTTTDMLGTYQTSNIHTVQVSGNVLGTGVTWTTPTAAAIVTAYKPTAVANLSMFNFQVQNLGSSTVTIAGGTGVTISGTSSVLAATTELYRCIITNIGSGTQAATCTGVI